MHIVHGQQALASTSTQFVSQSRVGRRQWRLLGDERMKTTVAMIKIGCAHCHRPHACIGVPMRRCGGKMWAVTGDVGKKRPPSSCSADTGALDPFDCLIADQRRRILACALHVHASRRLIVLPSIIRVGERSALEPTVKTFVSIEIGLTKETHLVAGLRP